MNQINEIAAKLAHDSDIISYDNLGRPLTALEVLGTRSVEALNACNAARDRASTWQERDRVCMKSYRNGEAIAYIDARRIMDAELRRLCNKFQNGALSVSDFGLVL